MRNLLIEQIYSLEDRTDIRAMEDFTRWSNLELLQYYGSLCVEEYYQKVESEHDEE